MTLNSFNTLSLIRHQLTYVITKFGLLCGICLIVVTMSSISVAQPNYEAEPFYNNTFPKSTPGANGSWEVEDFLPDIKIASPLKIINIPNANEIFVLSKIGEVWKINLEDKSQTLLLDIKDRCMKLGEGGSVGIAIHPKYNNDGNHDFIYVFYRNKPLPDEYSNLGFNRLAKFTLDKSQGIFPGDSEEILIQQYDQHIWHNGGALFFDNEGFLFVCVGDEGDSDKVDIKQSTQRIDQGFFGGILRIDVDNDMSRSHPIRRQPVQLGMPPTGWGTTYSQGYSIPNDNPWVNPNGDNLEEFFAIGVRAPYSAFYDALNDNIWVSDVGGSKLEEINLIKKAGNYQWPYVEGDLSSDTYPKPDPIIGTETAPYYFYARDIGSAIVGGAIYRGNKFPSLDEKFIFADYVSKKVMLIDHDAEEEPLILINNVRDSDIDFPAKPGIAGVSILKDGTVLISIISGSDFLSTGRLLSLKNKDVVPDPPLKLSELHVFKDFQARTIADGFIPYDVNSPLWSDRAVKSRWVSIPNDGTFDQASEKIKFKALDDWEFPTGTVTMKHFELPLDLADESSTVPLETRFFVLGEDGIGYGLTYKWNADGTEAFLQQSRSEETFEIRDNGVYTYDQIWDYPSRSNCMSCHNSAAGFALGMNTHQMNKEVLYPNTNMALNQLTYLNDLGIFDQNIGNPNAYLRSFPIENKIASLDIRIRSYLDANCSFCHRPGGSVTTSNMDLRFPQPFTSQFIARLPTESVASTQEFIVEPGDHSQSEIWLRDASRSTNQMPPLASNLVHQTYVDSLAKWIDNLSIDMLDGADIKLWPNPSSDFMRLDVGESWLPEYTLKITDMNGIQRISKTYDNSINIIELHSFEAGVYLIEIKRDALIYRKKIVVY